MSAELANQLAALRQRLENLERQGGAASIGSVLASAQRVSLRLQQAAHGFIPGDCLGYDLTDSTWKKASASTTWKPVGIVDRARPNYFTLIISGQLSTKSWAHIGTHLGTTAGQLVTVAGGGTLQVLTFADSTRALLPGAGGGATISPATVNSVYASQSASSTPYAPAFTKDPVIGDATHPGSLKVYLPNTCVLDLATASPIAGKTLTLQEIAVCDPSGIQKTILIPCAGPY